MAIFTFEGVDDYEGLDAQAPAMTAAGWTHAFDDDGDPVEPDADTDAGDGGDGQVPDHAAAVDAVQVTELPTAVIQPAADAGPELSGGEPAEPEAAPRRRPSTTRRD